MQMLSVWLRKQQACWKSTVLVELQLVPNPLFAGWLPNKGCPIQPLVCGTGVIELSIYCFVVL
jgi:hypothetical protein